MVSQAAIRVLDVAAVPGSTDVLDAKIELRCGCVIERRVAADRILEREDGEPFAVGKFPCPVGHRV